MTEKTFIKVTNKEIYDEMTAFHAKNDEQHRQIIQRLDITNGKVKMGKWIATTAFTVALLVLGFLMTHIGK